MARPRKTAISATADAAAHAPESDVALDGDTPATAGALRTDYLQTLVGYNARRAALAVIGTFLERMAPFGVRPVDFSVLSIIRHNPGVTSRQLCTSLGLLPPNLVALLNQLDKRQLIERRPHPTDGRAVALFLSETGESMMALAEAEATELEKDVTVALTEKQRNTLIELLKKVYEPKGKR